MKDRIHYLLEESGYDDGILDDVLECADTRGWGALDQQIQSALSCYLDEEEIADERLAPWEPVGWDD